MRLILPFLICVTLQLNAQFDYTSKTLDPIPLGLQVDVSALGPDFRPNMSYLEGPKQTSTRLEKIKEEIALKYPKQYDIQAKPKSLTDPPEVIIGFESNSYDGSVPEDNNIAISNDGQILAVANSNVSMRFSDGSTIRNRTLENFTGSLAEGLNKYDPKTLYDPTTDKFIFVCLAGTNSASNKILVGFSESNELNSTWNLYEIEGNPRGDNTWSDYPMISVTENELFITVNLLKDGFSWQEGFEETLIYQINKFDGYNGEELSIRQWSDIKQDGKFVRNICPIKYADENLGQNQYFVSSLNFAIQTDTFFLFEITGEMDQAELKLDIRNADFTYGAPPVANQPTKLLQTNDARVLDGFLHNDDIQFVGNSINPTTGFADAYHGYITNMSGSKDITGGLLGGSNVEFGYPGIAWTGEAPEDIESIIVISHSAIDKFPGISAIYYDNLGQYSDLTEVKEGDGYINELSIQDERWGDYIGIQRKYNEPGIVWINGTFGLNTNNGLSYSAQISKPGWVSSTVEIPEQTPIKVFPNPVIDETSVSFEVFNYDNVNISLFDAQGALVKLLYNDKPKKIGLVNFSFNSNALPEGIFVMNIVIGDKLLTSKKIVKSY